MTFVEAGGGGSTDLVARYFDVRGRERKKKTGSEGERDLVLLRHAGRRSADLLAQVPVSRYVKWRAELQRGRGMVNAAVRDQERRLEKWACRQIGDLAICEVRQENVDELLRRWEEAGLAEATVEGIFGILAETFDIARSRGAVGKNVVRMAGGKRTWRQRVTPARIPEEEVVERLRAGCDPEDAAFLELVLATRPSARELAALCSPDFDLRAGTVTYRFYLDGTVMAEQAWPAAVRTLDLGDAASAAIERWVGRKDRPDSPLVFCRPDGGRHSHGKFAFLTRRVQYDAGLESDLARTGTPRGGKGQPRTNSFDSYRPPYTLQELGNVAVLDWFLSGADPLELQRRMGLTDSRGLKRFRSAFDAVSLDGSAFDAADAWLGAVK